MTPAEPAANFATNGLSMGALNAAVPPLLSVTRLAPEIGTALLVLKIAMAPLPIVVAPVYKLLVVPEKIIVFEKLPRMLMALVAWLAPIAPATVVLATGLVPGLIVN